MSTIRNIKPEDITIVFCVNKGYNWTRLAVESFKYTNPEYSDRIVIFDDNFKYAKHLNKYVSDIITWKNFERNENIYVRMGEMYQDCSMQINTKYICFIDNDTVSFGQNWLSTFLSEGKEIDRVVGAYNTLDFKNKEDIETLPPEYRECYEAKGLKRFHYYCIIIDQEYFKKNYNIYGYYGNPEYCKDFYFDVGTEFYYFCLKHNIPFTLEGCKIENEYLMHIHPNPTNTLSNMLDENHIPISGAKMEEYKKEFANTIGFERACRVANEIGYNFEDMYFNMEKVR